MTSVYGLLGVPVSSAQAVSYSHVSFLCACLMCSDSWYCELRRNKCTDGLEGFITARRLGGDSAKSKTSLDVKVREMHGHGDEDDLQCISGA